jgi:hypothetical protein
VQAVQATNDVFEQAASFVRTPFFNRNGSTYVQTASKPEQRAQPRIAEADVILKTCVHCGFCLTYMLIRDENDAPRGSINLFRAMSKKAASL